MRWLALLVVLPCCMAAILLRTGHVDLATAERVPNFDSRHDLNSVDQQPKSLYLCALRQQFTSDEKADVERVVGHPLDEYLPTNAFMLYTTESQAAKAATLPHVTFVGPVQTHMKIAPELSSVSDQHNGLSLLLVLAKGARATDELARRLFPLLPFSGLGAVQVVSPDRLLVTIPPNGSAASAALALAAHPDIAWIEQRIPARIMNPDAVVASSQPSLGGHPVNM